MATNANTSFEEHRFIPREELAEIQAALSDGDFSEAVEKVRRSLQSLENAELHVAITGFTGAGRSTFVNAIRGLGDENKDSAPAGEVQNTTTPEKYVHLKFKNVTFWDLPGFDTPDFNPGTYLQQVNFSRYDFFIIISSERFRCEDAQLAREMQKMGKNFYFVRAKVDNDINASKKRRRGAHDENKVLQRIREDCLSSLKKAGVTSAPVFLVSSFELQKYDFESLTDTLLGSLDFMKRRAFLLSIPNVSQAIFEKKKAELKKPIWMIAAASAAIAAIPAPGLSFAVDIGILAGAMYRYCHCFGLADQSLEKLARQVGKSLDYIKKDIKYSVNKGISKDMVVKMLTKTWCGAAMIAEYIVSAVPIVGSLIASGISFATTYYMLYTFVNELAEDAQRVLIRALHETEI